VALPGIFIGGCSTWVWGRKSPVGSRGKDLVEGLGDEVSQKRRQFAVCRRCFDCRNNQNV